MSKRRREAAPLLEAQRSDPIAFVRQRGRELAGVMKLRPRMVEECIGVAVETLGENWLREECARKPPVLRGVLGGHRLVQAFKTGDQHALASILELGLYARRLATRSGFRAVLDGLRERYASTMLQLGVGYRIDVHGPRVEFEPGAAGGRRGDIAFRWAGRDYQVECYSRQPERDPLEDVLVYSIPRVLELAPCRDNRLRIELRLGKVPSDAERLELEREARRLVAASAVGSAVVAVVAAGRLKVECLSDDEEPDLDANGVPMDSGPSRDADVVCVQSEAYESDLLKPIRLRVGVNGTRVVLWRPPRAGVQRDERISRFVDRIERKMAQTRVEGGRAGRIVVAQLLDGDVRATREHRLLDAVQGRLSRNHENVAGIVICTRVLREGYRPAYVGAVLPGRDHDPFVDAWPRWALDTDGPGDLFANWNRG